MKIIWVLFYDVEPSYLNAIKDDFEIYFIGFNDIVLEENKNYHHYKINRSSPNFSIFKELGKLTRPNVILISPPCESWIGNDKRELADSIICTTIELIDFFKPNVWVIDNPKSSRLWEFIDMRWGFRGVKNICNEIIFKSNIEINFTRENKKYDELIKDIKEKLN